MDKYKSIAKLISEELGKISINTSNVSLSEAKHIISNCQNIISDYCNELGQQEATFYGGYLYGVVSDWLDLMKDLSKINDLIVLRESIMFFYKGYMVASIDSILKEHFND